MEKSDLSYLPESFSKLGVSNLPGVDTTQLIPMHSSAMGIDGYVPPKATHEQERAPILALINIFFTYRASKYPYDH